MTRDEWIKACADELRKVSPSLSSLDFQVQSIASKMYDPNKDPIEAARMPLSKRPPPDYPPPGVPLRPQRKGLPVLIRSTDSEDVNIVMDDQAAKPAVERAVAIESSKRVNVWYTRGHPPAPQKNKWHESWWGKIVVGVTNSVGGAALLWVFTQLMKLLP